jgi:integrase
VVPLVGASLWAAKRLQTHDSSFAFPSYCSQTVCKANSASGALNKWMKPRVRVDGVVHSFRHSLRDRLRAVECPSDIIDQIGGWSSGTVGSSYGKGY